MRPYCSRAKFLMTRSCRSWTRSVCLSGLKMTTAHKNLCARTCFPTYPLAMRRWRQEVPDGQVEPRQTHGQAPQASQGCRSTESRFADGYLHDSCLLPARQFLGSTNTAECEGTAVAGVHCG